MIFWPIFEYPLLWFLSSTKVFAVTTGILVPSMGIFAVLTTIKATTGLTAIAISDFLCISVIRSDANLALTEFSSWNILVLGIFSSLIGLWIYSSYLEFDPSYLSFVVRLVLFLFSVWLSVNSAGLLLLLFGWESIGLISFLLIGTFFSRSFTSSSSFSAIGFNRAGDVLLLILVSTFAITQITSNSAAGITSNVALLGFVLAMQFKSVTAISQLWLPEAMEGPTPVSSLLHSCTLVMAGIFVFTNLGTTSLEFLSTTFSFSLLVVVFSSRQEKDFKRTIAFSTVILVGFIWVLALESTTITALAICAAHAAYKSSLFVSTGRMLVSTSTYVDGISPALSAGRSLVILPGLFLIGFSGTSYAAAKHGVDTVVWSGNLSSITAVLVVGFGLLVFWELGIRSSSNLKVLPTANVTDFLPWIMVVTIVVFATGIAGPVGVTSGNAVLSNPGTGIFGLILGVFLAAQRWAIRSFPTLGSVNIPTGMAIPVISWYSAVKVLVRSASKITSSMNSGITPSAIPIALFGVVLALLVVSLRVLPKWRLESISVF